jgi:hypothetical protein
MRPLRIAQQLNAVNLTAVYLHAFHLTAVKLIANSLCKGPSNPSAQSSKKDGSATNQTPLEKMLMNAGPIRNDGSDKFFGMENV